MRSWLEHHAEEEPRARGDSEGDRQDGDDNPGVGRDAAGTRVPGVAANQPIRCLLGANHGRRGLLESDERGREGVCWPMIPPNVATGLVLTADKRIASVRAAAASRMAPAISAIRPAGEDITGTIWEGKVYQCALV